MSSLALNMRTLLANLATYRDVLAQMDECADAERTALMHSDDDAFSRVYARKEDLLNKLALARTDLDHGFDGASMLVNLEPKTTTLSDLLQTAPEAMSKPAFALASEIRGLTAALAEKYALIGPLVENRLSYYRFFGHLLSRIAEPAEGAATYRRPVGVANPLLVDQAA